MDTSWMIYDSCITRMFLLKHTKEERGLGIKSSSLSSYSFINVLPLISVCKFQVSTISTLLSGSRSPPLYSTFSHGCHIRTVSRPSNTFFCLLTLSSHHQLGPLHLWFSVPMYLLRPVFSYPDTVSPLFEDLVGKQSRPLF